jgi:hypothetical protein
MELGNHASTQCPQPPYEPGCRSLCCRYEE